MKITKRFETQIKDFKMSDRTLRIWEKAPRDNWRKIVFDMMIYLADKKRMKAFNAWREKN
jgi:hypothetical protein